MALLTKQNVTRAGVVPAYTAAAGGGDEFVPGDETYLHVKNGSGGSITVTIVTPRTAKGQAIADVAVAIAAGAEKLIGPFPDEDYADPSDPNRRADITYSGVTSLTIGCFALSRG
jgi:hypothetical protein